MFTLPTWIDLVRCPAELDSPHASFRQQLGIGDQLLGLETPHRGRLTWAAWSAELSCRAGRQGQLGQ